MTNGGQPRLAYALTDIRSVELSVGIRGAGDSSSGLSASLQDFTDAINEISSTPSSISARQVLLAQGRALVDRLQSYDARLRQMHGWQATVQ